MLNSRHKATVCSNFSKIVELEEELRIVGNNMKSLEVSEQEVIDQHTPSPPYPFYL